MNRYIVIRHGETDQNKNNIALGSTDAILNDTGISQALHLKEELKEIPFDIVYASPLLRAYHTAEIVSNIPIKIDSRLQERFLGDFEGQSNQGIPWEKLDNYYLNYTEKNIEKIQSVYKRIKDFFDEIDSCYQNKTIAIFTHGGVMRSINAYFNGIPENGDFNEFSPQNCEYFIFEK